MTDRDRDELIQAVLDGTASHEDAARLKQLAGADIELNERKTSYKALFDALSLMPVAEAPPDLRANVLAAIEGRTDRAPEPTRAASRRVPVGLQPRMVFALAATLVAAMLGYVAWRGTAVPRSAPVAGTMAPAGRSPAGDLPAEAATPWALGETVVDGYLIREGDTWRATLNARGAEAVQVELAIEPPASEVISVVPGAGGRRLTSDTPGRVALELLAPGRAEVTLRSPDGTPPRILITLSTPGASARGRLEERKPPGTP